MPTAITNRTGVANLLQRYLLIPDCANQYCFAGVFGHRPSAAYRPIRASTDSFGGNSGGNFLEHKTMPRDGAIIFGDLIGKVDDLRVSCDKCGRSGRYQVQRLIRDRGRDGKIVDWLDQITADCPKKATVSWNDRCAARCPDLPRVL
jgi:hypothetical protein